MDDRDFFISHSSIDRSWAEWVAWVLEDNGYSVHVQAWDFRPGGNFVYEMQERICSSKRLIGIITQSFLSSIFTQPEWTSAFVNDPTSKDSNFVPIKVGECEPRGMLKSIIHINLLGLSEDDAIKKLIAGINTDRCKPETKPQFPGSNQYTPFFPNVTQPEKEIRDKYEDILTREFKTLTYRLKNPQINSNTSTLFYGEGFKKDGEIIPAISKYSLFLDVEKLLNATIGKYTCKMYCGVEESKPHLVYKMATCRWRIFVAAIADGLEKFDSNLLLSPFISGICESSASTKPVLELSKHIKEYIHYEDRRNKSENYDKTKQLLYLLGCVGITNGIQLEDILNEEQQKYRFEYDKHSVPRNAPSNYRVLKVYFSDLEGTYELILQAFALQSINIVSSKSWTLLSKEVAAAELVIECHDNRELELSIKTAFKSEKLSNVYTRYEFMVFD